MVTFTAEQASLLELYIHLTKSFREDEAESWRKLAREKKPDGTPAYGFAEGHVRYWEEIESKLMEIKDLIEKSKWTA